MASQPAAWDSGRPAGWEGGEGREEDAGWGRASAAWVPGCTWDAGVASLHGRGLWSAGKSWLFAFADWTTWGSLVDGAGMVGREETEATRAAYLKGLSLVVVGPNYYLMLTAFHLLGCPQHLGRCSRRSSQWIRGELRIG